jgi:hypothetical protein
LNVPILFFFEDPLVGSSQRKTKAVDPPISHMSELISSADGQALTKAFIKIKDAKLRRSIAAFVAALAERISEPSLAS